MVANNANVQTTKVNYELLCDVETFLGLDIELVQGLSKLAQGQQTFICDFVNAFKLCKVDPQEMYYDTHIQFSSQQIWFFS